jgi:hypothetical protein
MRQHAAACGSVRQRAAACGNMRQLVQHAAACGNMTQDACFFPVLRLSLFPALR